MTSATDTISIPAWANGPDDSGNGGWSAGLLAERMGHAAIAEGIAVSLRVPPPLDRPLRIARTDRGLDLFDDAGDEPVLVAAAEPEDVSIDAPAAIASIDVDQAAAASVGFPFRTRHPFPRCVCCGIARPANVPSLGLHCGPCPGVSADDGAPVFVDRWVTSVEFADRDEPDVASIAATWSALDCPSAAPIADPDATAPIVLARIAARIVRRPRVGDAHVLAAWHVSSDGRKHVTRSVMRDPSGQVIAAADALWIEVRPR